MKVTENLVYGLSELSPLVKVSLSIAFPTGFTKHAVPFLCPCVGASCAEVSGVPGQSPSLGSEAGAAHPDGSPSQPHALHRSQVTNGNRLRLRVTDGPALVSFCFHLMPQPPICCHAAEDIQHFFLNVKRERELSHIHWTQYGQEESLHPTLPGPNLVL